MTSEQIIAPLEERAARAAGLLRGEASGAQYHVNDHGTKKLLIGYDTLNEVLALLEGWQLEREESS